MIKLKWLLENRNYIGNVNYAGFVDGHPLVDLSDQHPDYGVGSGDRWRYYERENSVVWADEPPSMDYIHAVNDWLSKKGISPVEHWSRNDMIWNIKDTYK